jgi:ketosteroid isomerase-like protein
LSTEERARIAEEVDATVRGYVSAIQSLDADRMLAFWADVDGFAMARDGALIVGYEPWAALIQTFVETTSEVTHTELRNPQVYVLARDAASYSTEFEWSITSVEGVTTNVSGSWTYVFKRFPEGWRVVHSAGTHVYS